MKKVMRTITPWLLGSLFLTASCTHSIHDVYTSGFDPYTDFQKGKRIEARSEQFVIMGFAKDTSYVDQAYEQISNQCSGGEVKGLTTQFSTSHGFFSWTNKIFIKGYCFASK